VAGPPRKLVLAVIDGLKPAMLERAIASGRAPVLAAIVQRGAYVDSCCAAFPSVTPVCAATIATGVRQDEHRIASMNWYFREETRYVLAKSVGWGWLGYHAFLAAEALAEFVPPVLGLRQGILYTEWLPQRAGLALGDRAALVRRAASYARRLEECAAMEPAAASRRLQALPGIGPYTASAIAAIAFDRRTMPVDGNIERVVSRLYAVEDPLPQAKPLIQRLAATLLADTRAGDCAQALMDLGSSICTPGWPSSPTRTSSGLAPRPAGRHAGRAPSGPKGPTSAT